MKMVLEPIGTVVSKDANKSLIEIYPDFVSGLKAIERNDHIWIIFWMHKLRESDRKILVAHPMGDRTKDKRGVFALRSPMRPNPMGLTKVELMERSHNLLVVAGLDAFEGSPILDIKPA
jgi:tRNA-Thr(GGU) m(6)t(6)A37 methyltransferase TsaA